MKTLGTLPFSFTLTGLACCALLSTVRAAAQGSDDCSTAQVIAGTGTFLFDTSVATSAAEGQVAGCSQLGLSVDADVWFLWTAPQSGTLLVSTCGQTSVDTKVALYTNTVCSTSMFPVLCSDDNCGIQSQATVQVVAGTQYMLQVGCGPFSGPGGTGTFELTFTTPFSNDDCALPAVISGAGSFLFDSGGMSTSAQQPGSGCVNIAADLWFRWTSPATGTATLSTCGQTAFDSAIAVYDGGVCPTVHSIACDDDACGLQSLTSWSAVAGADYMIQVGSSGGFSQGLGTITIEIASIPAHDDCSTPLSVGGGGAAFDTSNATTGVEGQGNPCGPIQNDLWFEWTAPSSGLATLETCGTTGDDTSIAVYPAGGCPAGAATACDDNGCGAQSTVSFPVTSGSVWLVQIGEGPSAFGSGGAFTAVVGPPPMTPYCFGDGSGSPCPCSNFGLSGRGCANSLNVNGAELAATGMASVSGDTVVLSGSGMPNAAVLYLQGTVKDNFGFGTTLFDGIRCVDGAIVRLATKINSSGGSAFPSVGDPLLSVRGGVPAAGGTFLYQAWYRNAAVAFCPPETANWTNGIEVLWIP